MKFYALTKSDSSKTEDALRTEYRNAQEIGKIRLGFEQFYFRSAHRVYYIPYTDIYRYFRRVMLVPAKLCCGRGDFAIEHLVICDADKELAQIQLPGSHAAKVLMERMLALAPDAIVGMPDKEPDGSEEEGAAEEDNTE